MYVRFFAFPMSPSDVQVLTSTLAGEFALTLASANPPDVPVLVRFGHEMNGSWYPWSQDPTADISAFHLLADAVHTLAPGSTMVWAPNYGGGYPVSG